MIMPRLFALRILEYVACCGSPWDWCGYLQTIFTLSVNFVADQMTINATKVGDPQNCRRPRET